MSTWGWSGTPQLTSGVLCPRMTLTHRISAPSQVGRESPFIYFLSRYRSNSCRTDTKPDKLGYKMPCATLRWFLLSLVFFDPSKVVSLHSLKKHSTFKMHQTDFTVHWRLIAFFLSFSFCVCVRVLFVGVCHRDSRKRQSYFSSLSDISDNNKEADLVGKRWSIWLFGSKNVLKEIRQNLFVQDQRDVVYASPDDLLTIQ